jgi:hypothetical protein
MAARRGGVKAVARGRKRRAVFARPSSTACMRGGSVPRLWLRARARAAAPSSCTRFGSCSPVATDVLDAIDVLDVLDAIAHEWLVCDGVHSRRGKTRSDG